MPEGGVQEVQVARRGREAVVREGVAVEVMVVLAQALEVQREARPHDERDHRRNNEATAQAGRSNSPLGVDESEIGISRSALNRSFVLWPFSPLYPPFGRFDAAQSLH